MDPDLTEAPACVKSIYFQFSVIYVEDVKDSHVYNSRRSNDRTIHSSTVQSISRKLIGNNSEVIFFSKNPKNSLVAASHAFSLCF